MTGTMYLTECLNYLSKSFVLEGVDIAAILQQLCGGSIPIQKYSCKLELQEMIKHGAPGM